MELFYNPVSTYSQKVLLAFYEKNVAFTPQVIQLMDEQASARYREIYPLGKIPLLRLDDGHMIPESTIIVEYLEGHYPDPPLIPAGVDEARQCRFADRMHDLYLNGPVVTLLMQGMQPEDQRDAAAAARAHEQLDIVYGYMNQHLADHQFSGAEHFSMGDCAALPALEYARRVKPWDQHAHIARYVAEGQQRPSWQRVAADAQPILAAMGL